MRRLSWIATALACLAGVAQAEEVDFAAKSKTIAAMAAVRAPAPFAGAPIAAARDPAAAAIRGPVALGVEHGSRDRRIPRSACERSAHDLCYDAADGRIVYRAARNYMPRIGELTPESVSIHRHRIVFKYSF